MATGGREGREMTVGDVAMRSGIAVSTVHFYESKGLIRSRRTSGNQRRYARDTLRRIAFVRVAQRVGIQLNEIRAALEQLPEERTPTAQDWARLSAAWRGELDQRIDQLLRLRDTLTDCIGCGCLSLQVCRLSNPGDALAADGPGPRRLLSPADPAPVARRAEVTDVPGDGDGWVCPSGPGAVAAERGRPVTDR